ncbi:MAG: T9SS type B sorting domain-containing protein [Flaviramulus sp.]|nr:T9SS type B sorting domain-containing protein [Flaviramulus sp.]NNC51156.1 T9SS type B sorting domain-containing protein [Flaviramulus sp.]
MKRLFYYLFILTCCVSYSQQEASNWYFGENAGINFNASSGIVNALTDGEVNTREGCATISDEDGELLFYTDGITIYNKDHFVMANGDGLLGDSSSTQSAIIVPLPNDPDIYYVFTVGSNQNRTGLKYSIVDISLNGGAGEVVVKNNNLLNECAEKISAVVKDCSSGSIWIVALSNSNGTGIDNLNTFFVYELSTSGLNSNPIKSSFNITITDSRGYLKISPDGTKMACANIQSGLFLFDFDSATGNISNVNQLQIYDQQNNKPYGVEFSPDSQLLYVTSTNDFFGTFDQNENPQNHTSILLQFDLNSVNIAGTQVVLDSRTLYRGGLQLGPDGKIYRALSSTYNSGLPFLSVINNPNTQGVGANYSHNAIVLGNNNSTQGLPPFVQSFFTEKMDIIRNGTSSISLNLCEGETYTLVADEIPGAQYSWTNNGRIIVNNTYFLEVTEEGNYEVSIETDPNDCSTIKGKANVKYVDFPDINNVVLRQCDDDVSDGLSFFNLSTASNEVSNGDTDLSVSFYLTQNDALNDQNKINTNIYENISNPQTLYVSAINKGLLTPSGIDENNSAPTSNCYSYAEIQLEVVSNSISNISVNVCDELNSEDGISTFNLEDITLDIQSNYNISFPITYYNTFNDALLQQGELELEFTNSIPYSQIIFSRVQNGNNCVSISEVLINITPLPILIGEETTYYCLNNFPESKVLNAGLINGSIDDYTYLWSNGDTTYETEINAAGIYTVTVSNADGCSKQRTVKVENSNVANFDNIEVLDATKNNVVTILVSGEGIYEYGLIDNDNIIYAPYQESSVFENVKPGLYRITVRDIKNNCGEINTQVSVIGFPKFFSPNNDGFNDTWQVYGVSEMFQHNSLIYIYNRYGKLLKQLSPLQDGWDGTFNGSKLPSDDYWFAVTLQDGRIFKNHFTLIY